MFRRFLLVLCLGLVLAWDQGEMMIDDNSGIPEQEKDNVTSTIVPETPTQAVSTTEPYITTQATADVSDVTIEYNSTESDFTTESNFTTEEEEDPSSTTVAIIETTTPKSGTLPILTNLYLHLLLPLLVCNFFV